MHGRSVWAGGQGGPRPRTSDRLRSSGTRSRNRPYVALPVRVRGPGPAGAVRPSALRVQRPGSQPRVSPRPLRHMGSGPGAGGAVTRKMLRGSQGPSALLSHSISLKPQGNGLGPCHDLLPGRSVDDYAHQLRVAPRGVASAAARRRAWLGLLNLPVDRRVSRCVSLFGRDRPKANSSSGRVF